MATATRSGDLFGHIVRGLGLDALDPIAVVARARARAPTDASLARLHTHLTTHGSDSSPFVGELVPAAAAWALWEEIVATTGTLATAWKYATAVPSASSSQLVRMLATTSPSLHAAAHQVAAYSSLVAQAYRFEVEELADGSGVLRVGFADPSPGARADLVYLLSVICRWAERMAGHSLQADLTLSLTWSERDVQLEGTASLPVIYGAPHCSVQMSAAIWREPSITADTALSQRLATTARAELERVSPLLEVRVRDAIAALPPTAKDAAAVAKHCGVSMRNMRRELQREGTSFQRVLDRWRADTARAWLARESDGELAQRLGFSDARSFRRAYIGWTGMTPAQMRTRTTRDADALDARSLDAS